MEQQRTPDNTKGLGDPEARVGRGDEGFYLGYQSLFLTDLEGFPLGHVEVPANINEKKLVKRLLEQDLGEQLKVELVAGDSQRESRNVFQIVEQPLASCKINAQLYFWVLSC